MQSIMQPVVYHSDYFLVETNHGLEVIPCHLVGLTADIRVEALWDYLEGTPLDDETIPVQRGWVGNMSAPGYLDCTAYVAGRTKQEVLDCLEEMYGDDDYQ